MLSPDIDPILRGHVIDSRTGERFVPALLPPEVVLFVSKLLGKKAVSKKTAAIILISLDPDGQYRRDNPELNLENNRLPSVFLHWT
ncbi:MAG: hypothetical protein UX91_C0004G0015 [Candidatus Amesbacteria bacterium GW2011_GWB1_47_19]|nr:MAG: hypothetical protein UW51_C0005G0015 [Candidatus Amesbacteria bacterium GW2011_GWA1_44_24]KKU31572.1 MAG: hypothetical protein UX46_C0004G0015 [Candidatus Amesbacteria bacterium GW2011_GWC1_46_24]KKU67345.1 MAG: hypothetical protein UX91_C0004G0015 [Candidatus Amesbacteria bacterium GW2011_GWB1_47_19]OGD05240.1 MAG: hypothetical protein A2379_04505 [Candidatus Amesbacteria bacterium RIFOXYB1_FULL_47_13]HBC72605.1 hypothetical protein [Candidatus Amesbacteria bacterium]